MSVKVSVFGIDAITYKDKIVELEDGSTVKNLIEILGISDEKVSVVMHNKRQVNKEHILEGNSEVYLVGIVAGG
jgi:sulfur carrier protein ThiS